PKAVGKMYSEALGKLHFWVTCVGSYLIFFPMFGEGFLGLPRRYFSFRGIESFPAILNDLNVFITVVALVVGAAQLIFVFNLVWSVFKGRKAEANPWRATTLEWQTPTTPPPHGNWGDQLPVVHRGAYDYSLPDAPQDYIPQTVPPSERARVRA
ncbi:MAG: cbb3-type cytochrome c oxidase subunit I, partial [Candidatus Bipolaricaulota bacterium]|nr:cbb3-type cytochrome c oxidase subunit I [Candidatus Bipolaricaulota bacterium]